MKAVPFNKFYKGQNLSEIFCPWCIKEERGRAENFILYLNQILVFASDSTVPNDSFFSSQAEIIYFEFIRGTFREGTCPHYD